MPNQLYYGDNLTVLREYIKDESVDLIYLDPPFNSRADYNVLFAEKDGTQSASQITAFEDTWAWNTDAERAYEEVVERADRVSDAMRAFRTFLLNSDMMAYLAMMAPRLIELKRVLKVTGSIYLHCDPTASHYLKMLMDAIFGAMQFRNEIIWKRTSGHADAVGYGAVHDTILFYTNGGKTLWNDIYQPYEESYVDQYYRYKDIDGRRWKSGDLSAAGLSGGGYDYEWKGITRIWRCPLSTMEKLEADGLIFYTKNGIPRKKQYLDQAKGMPAQDIWSDIEALRSWHQEKLGYPTQKPEALLERIIKASSNEGDVVLDPFCGCGTAIVASQNLKRQWVGIDVTHLAIGLIKQRLSDKFGDKIKGTYEVHGEPTDLSGARKLAEEDKFQFEAWALSLVGARHAGQVRRGPDRGIDGRLFFHDESGGGKSKQIILSVKGGHVEHSHVRDLRGVLDRENAQIGVLITLDEPTKPMLKEAASAGFYTSPAFADRKYPRLQILTIEEMLEGKSIEYPRLLETTFKQAPRAKGKAAENLNLDLGF